MERTMDASRSPDMLLFSVYFPGSGEMKEWALSTIIGCSIAILWESRSPLHTNHQQT